MNIYSIIILINVEREIIAVLQSFPANWIVSVGIFIFQLAIVAGDLKLVPIRHGVDKSP